MAKRYIRWECIQMTASGRVPLPEGILEVRFFHNNSSTITGTVVINKTIQIQAFNQFTDQQVLNYPYEVILINNENEVDATEYYAQIPTGSLLTVLYKYSKK